MACGRPLKRRIEFLEFLDVRAENEALTGQDLVDALPNWLRQLFDIVRERSSSGTRMREKHGRFMGWFNVNFPPGRRR